MGSFDILPNYVEPCISQGHNSLASTWLTPSDFGECYSPPLESLLYPRLIPVYNGKVLNIDSELVHASLSGISIKHYDGKCTKPQNVDILYGDDTELYDYEILDDISGTLTPSPQKKPSKISTESDSFSYRMSWHNEGEPLCALPKINFRNSFWNIHQPEMCKLTWGQKYVSAATVIEHLHDHLVHHGPLCNGFHTEQDRNIMLNKELDEYVRLKVKLCPKEIPPDEPLYNFKDPPSGDRVSGVLHPSCKTQITEAIEENERFIPLSDDEEVTEKRIHRSEEEFCVTIGKHVRKSPILKPIPAVEEPYISPRHSCAEEREEDYDSFYYDWYLYSGEEYLETYSDKTESGSSIITESDFPIKVEDKLDEFCRGVGKADYSDIQCKPDF